VALAFAALLISAPAASACRGGNRPAGSQSPSATRHAIRCLINKRRVRHGLRAVRGDAPLANASQSHADAMARENFFSHVGPDGNPGTRAAAAGYPETGRWSVGELLGFGTGRAGSPGAIVADWMHSSEHRTVLLSPGWRQVGIGVTKGSPFGADGPGMATYAVDFGFHDR
jgi:uncharacterized protein YkwD